MSYPSNSDSVAQDQIRAFVDRILRLKEEAKAINGDIREVYAEAKGNGFDKTVLGKLVAYVEKRGTDAAAQAESEALFDLYLSAYDGVKPSHAHARAYEDDSSTAARAPVQTGGRDAAAVDASLTLGKTEGHSEPASLPVQASGAPGDESAVLPSAALVVANADRKKPHPYCSDPEECGAEASWNHMCLSCHRRLEADLKAGASK